MNQTKEVEVKENKFVKWFKKVFGSFGMSKNKMLEAPKEEIAPVENAPEAPKVASKEERNEFVERLREQAESKPNDEKEQRDEGDEINIRVSQQDKEDGTQEKTWTTNEYLIHRIVEEYNKGNGKAIEERDLRYIETHPQYYGKEAKEYILDTTQSKWKDYTQNAGTAFAMVDNKNAKVITAVGVADGKARYVRSGSITDSDKNEYQGAEIQIDFNNIDMSKQDMDLTGDKISQVAYFAFSNELDKQIIADKRPTKDKEAEVIDMG